MQQRLWRDQSNGISLNGFTLNGFTLNGAKLNGHLNGIMNGFTLNGISFNGFTLNGMTLNGQPLIGAINVGGHQGIGLNGQVIAIEIRETRHRPGGRERVHARSLLRGAVRRAVLFNRVFWACARMSDGVAPKCGGRRDRVGEVGKADS